MDSPDARGEVSQNDAETPACQLCRTRKLRCSREIPSCSRCVRLGKSHANGATPLSAILLLSPNSLDFAFVARSVIDHVPGAACHYDYTRNKPGVKIGIIQTLSQRVGMW
jgi:hypothetical protein